MLMTLTEISIDTGIQGCVQPHTHAQCTVHLLAVKVLTPDGLPSPKGVQPHTHAQCTVHLLAVKVLTPDALPSPKGVILADSLP